MKTQATTRSTFKYDNLPTRPASKLIRFGAKFLPGIGKVQSQIVPYAKAWNRDNLAALQQIGPLWVVLGDSMSQGIGASSYDQGWVNQLQTMFRQAGINYRVLNLSVSGAKVRDVLDRQLPVIRQIDTKPDLVTVLIGSNDIASRKYRKQLLKNYGELLQRLPANSYLLSPFGNFGMGAKVNELIKLQAPLRHIKLIQNKLDSGLSTWKGKLAEDHFHPNDSGYKKFALLFYEAIKR